LREADAPPSSGRTEQCWCPTKHARRVLQAHTYYNGFVDFGDAESYRRHLNVLRAELAALERQLRAWQQSVLESLTGADYR